MNNYHYLCTSALNTLYPTKEDEHQFSPFEGQYDDVVHEYGSADDPWPFPHGSFYKFMQALSSLRYSADLI